MKAYAVPYPSFVLEVAVTQTETQLVDKLERWIVDGKGRISYAAGIWMDNPDSFDHLPPCVLVCMELKSTIGKDGKPVISAQKTVNKLVVGRDGKIHNEDAVWTIPFAHFFYLKKDHEGDDSYVEIPSNLRNKSIYIPIGRIHDAMQDLLDTLYNGSDEKPRTGLQLCVNRTNSSEVPATKYQELSKSHISALAEGNKKKRPARDESGGKQKKQKGASGKVASVDEEPIYDSIELAFVPASAVNAAANAGREDDARLADAQAGKAQARKKTSVFSAHRIKELRHGFLRRNPPREARPMVVERSSTGDNRNTYRFHQDRYSEDNESIVLAQV